MGLFDRLAKQGLNKVKDRIEKAAGVDLDNALDKLSDAIGQGASRQSAAESAAAPARPAYRAPAAPVDAAYFARILAEEFPEYAAEPATPASALGFAATLPAKPYDFALLQGGTCRAVVMLTEHNRDNNMAFKNAKQAAQSAGIPFINFYLHYPNERGYVIQRIRSFLA